jgi:L-ascorbate metabolism protein UlaG (beta-lactamase superfamily)
MTTPPLFFTFRWLGVAGLEFKYSDFSLLIDPYVSRISLPKVLFGKVRPNEMEISNRITAANAILATHSHFDHLMDVPVIAKKFNCPVYGSPNTCALLKRCDVPLSSIHEVAPEDDISMGPFHIKVLKSSHPNFLFSKPVTLQKTQKPPQHAMDFGMDSQFAYKIRAGQNSCLTDPGLEGHKESIDVLFISTLQGSRGVSKILKTLDSAIVVPIHWDNYFRRFTESLKAPGWGLLPVKRVSLQAMRSMVHTLTPRGRLFLPDPFKFYCLEDILYTNHEHPRFPTIRTI